MGDKILVPCINAFQSSTEANTRLLESDWAKSSEFLPELRPFSKKIHSSGFAGKHFPADLQCRVSNTREFHSIKTISGMHFAQKRDCGFGALSLTLSLLLCSRKCYFTASIESRNDYSNRESFQGTYGHESLSELILNEPITDWMNHRLEEDWRTRTPRNSALTNTWIELV